MRLLNTHTGRFEWHHDPTLVRYAILSHVWDANGEESYKDVVRMQKRLNQASSSELGSGAATTLLCHVSAKIRESCAYARANGYDLLWIDSCCIDKSSSAELSEAINSMYQWYAQATICYAFLFDVDGDENPRTLHSQFRKSKWFTRGWTLQELVAPIRVVFLSREWRPLGTLSSLATMVEEVTGIDRGVLLHQTPLNAISVARRMSWASKRITTRVEDEAYSLMGIFGVMMPTIYGEGRAAFARLQEEILKQVPDQSIFVWGPALRRPGLIYPAREYFMMGNALPRERSLFASSPRDFEHSADAEPESHLSLRERLGGVPAPFPEYTTTGYNVRTRMPVLSPREGGERSDTIHIGVLACVGADGNPVGLFLHANQIWMANGYYIGMTLDGDPNKTVYRTVSLTEEVLAQWASPEVAEIYLPPRILTSDPWVEPTAESLSNPFATYKIILPDWRRRELADSGYTVSCHIESSPSPLEEPPTHRFHLSSNDCAPITVEIGSCACRTEQMRATVEFALAEPTPRVNATNMASQSTPVSSQRTVLHKVVHPDHVNSYNWILDDESCGSASRDFARPTSPGMESAQDPNKVVRLTLSPSPEQWSDSAPRTWSQVYTLDIEILDPRDENTARESTQDPNGRLLAVDKDRNVYSNLWGYDSKKGKFFLARTGELILISL